MKASLAQKLRESVRDSYAAIAEEFDRTRQFPWEEFRHFAAYTKHGSRVLDLGCGNGRFYKAIEDRKPDYLGVDNSLELIHHARANFPSARFEYMDMMELNLPDNSFEAVFAIASLHHIPGRKNRKKVVQGVHSVLKPGGVFVLTVWNLFQPRYLPNLLRAFGSWILHFGFKYAWNDIWVGWGKQPIKRYYHAFTPRELRALFPARDWEIEESYFVRKGNRVPFWRSFNLVLIARKR